MKPKLRWKRGAILLQTLVVSVLLSMIAVMVLKWVFARYLVANRVQASAKNTGTAQAYVALNPVSIVGAGGNWGIPSNASTTLDGKPVSFTQSPSGQTGASRRFETTVADDY